MLALVFEPIRKVLEILESARQKTLTLTQSGECSMRCFILIYSQNDAGWELFHLLYLSFLDILTHGLLVL